MHCTPLFNLPFQTVDRPVHRPLALLGGPDRQEVQRAAGQPAEEREQGEPRADLERSVGIGIQEKSEIATIGYYI